MHLSNASPCLAAFQPGALRSPYAWEQKTLRCPLRPKRFFAPLHQSSMLLRSGRQMDLETPTPEQEGVEDGEVAFVQRGEFSRLFGNGEAWDLYRPEYADGSARPLFRGWIHALVTTLLVPSLLYLNVSVGDGSLAQQWLLLSPLLLGKLSSYAASANFHLLPSATTEEEASRLELDLAAIPLAMWAPCSVFASTPSEWVAIFGVMLGVSVANLKIVRAQLSGDASPLGRAALLLAYFAFSVGHIGSHYGFRGLWLAGVACYLGGFLVSPPVHHSLPAAPWHKAGRNGWHEDFHLLLAVADAVFLLMVVEFLQNM